ncbi:hypothetical protein KDK_46100 [Dictyobacter kobayashii]|uniref:Uncharacterized protein n=1 Tax=Dictyobacter kobayashii TaxID=2014872 RepID=A0A402APB1_9CHLR|nr:hypothetical protein KDK_46100 [Dictyobacter kobayashii]
MLETRDRAARRPGLTTGEVNTFQLMLPGNKCNKNKDQYVRGLLPLLILIARKNNKNMILPLFI